MSANSTQTRGRFLERIALHQTRLRTPGLSLDATGVAMGTRALVLLPNIERLVAFLSVYTRDRSLGEFTAGGASGSTDVGLDVFTVRSSLGTREVVLSLPTSSVSMLDVLADVGRLAGGLVFTGSQRYFVQVRDKLAPFGYDAAELLRVEAEEDLALHHSTFTQVYRRERAIDLSALVARLEPRLDPSSQPAGVRPLWLVSEPGVSGALLTYLARHGIDAEVGIAELPSASLFDDEPIRLSLFRIPELPARLTSLVMKTPGITAYAPAGTGVAVEVGYRHVIHLEGLPVFPPQGLALLAGATSATTRAKIGRRSALLLPTLPTFAPVASLVNLRLGTGEMTRLSPSNFDLSVTLPMRLAPSAGGLRRVNATLLSLHHAPLLRRLAYTLAPSALANASIVRLARVPSLGDALILRIPSGVESVPLGMFFLERASSLFVQAGQDVVPACPPSHLSSLLSSSAGQAAASLFVFRLPGDPAETIRAFSVENSAFVPLAQALVSPESWGALMPVEVVDIARAELEEPLNDIVMEPLGFSPMRGVG